MAGAVPTQKREGPLLFVGLLGRVRCSPTGRVSAMSGSFFSVAIGELNPILLIDSAGVSLKVNKSPRFVD